ncbi:MAG: hypothetical protein ACRBCS_09690 [Cellvibrionaceae bacterium]
MKLIALCLMTIFLTITGCSSNSNTERNKRPGYVTMNTEILGRSNTIMWEVNCGDFEISVADRNFEAFYKDDGTLMTMREYCDYSRDRMRRRK